MKQNVPVIIVTKNRRIRVRNLRTVSVRRAVHEIDMMTVTMRILCSIADIINRQKVIL